MDTELDNRGKYRITLSQDDNNDVRIMACDRIGLKTRVLDVGCACGDFGEWLVRCKSCDVHGMDFNSESIKIADSLNIYSQLNIVNLNTFQTDDFEHYKYYFDYIVLLDVLEHLIYPEDILLRLIPYLKYNGKLIISLPNISFGDVKLQLLQDNFVYTDTGILDRTHLRFFTWKSMVELFSKLGFEIISCQARIENICVPARTPWTVSYFIGRNINSYIYQYVFELNLSQLNTEELSNIA